MTFFGLSEAASRVLLFVLIFLVMAGLETLLPRRRRRYSRSRRWLTNFGVLASDYLSVFAVVAIVPVAAVLVAGWAGAKGWGLLNLVDWPLWLEWALALAFLDFLIWAQHLVTHKVPILWRVHRVHHTDEDLDASSAIRFHPIEIVFSMVIKSAAVLALGPSALMVVVFEAAVNGSALFNHANVKLPVWLDALLRLGIVTPDMHRVHHSIRHKETDSNYGFGLSIWDRIFGTYVAQPRDGHEGMVLGLAEWQDEAPTRLGWTLALPFTNPKPSNNDQ